MKNILITSAGRRVELVESFKEEGINGFKVSVKSSEMLAKKCFGLLRIQIRLN